MIDSTASAAPAAEPKRKASKAQFFIVFSPSGPAAPTVIHPTHKGALWVAHHMAKKHPGTKFFVMGSMSRPIRSDASEPAGEPEVAEAEAVE